MSRALTLLCNRGLYLRTVLRPISSADLRPTLWPVSRQALALDRTSPLRLLVTAAKSSKPDVAARRGSKDVKALARAFRPVPVTVLTVSKGASRAADDLAEEYAAKIRRYTAFSAVELRTNPKKAAATHVAIEAEGHKMLQALQHQDRVVVLDERGRDLTSETLAALVAEAGDSGVARLMFCIGGPYGHSQAVIDRADDVVRLSTMVLNHQVANIVLLEQIYRALTILRGVAYHH